MAQWNPRPAATFVDIRKRKPGYTWQPWDRNTAVAAPSGGGQPVESRFGRGEDGNLEYRGSAVTGNPERFTAQVMTLLKSETFLQELYDLQCPVDVRVRQKCDNPYDMTSYTEMIILRDGRVTSRAYSGEIGNATIDQDTDIMNQYDFSFGIEERAVKLVHDKISKTVVDFAINKVRSIGTPNTIDRCGVCSIGDQDFVFITDVDNTPGYSGNPAPIFGITNDGGNTWTTSYIRELVNGNAVDIVRAGSNLVVACPTLGVAYARLVDLQNGVANPWTLSTGFTAPNGANALAVVNGTKILAVGNSGRVWLSTDGGMSFTAIASASEITSQNLSSVVWAADNLAWIAGAAGVLIKYNGTTLSLMPTIRATIAGVVTTLTSNINVVNVAPTRGAEVYLGTAGGQIWRSLNALATTPVWEVPSLTLGGTGQIKDLQFAGLWGSVLFIIQSNVAGNTRVLRDLSGGALGVNVEVVGDFTSPVNNGMNSIAPVNLNTAIVGGEVDNTYAFIGKISGITVQ